ncbi:cation transporter [Aceticella autotrophica]|uniref:Cation transporter n=1 Tax=Aceticella autotrophica TaxID=2755338 RepID=A0A975AVS4_9THEO|nr:cation diffusion facilitator family transporter [Aceticella autotrophica]QSZ27318.1 cation transporter [Aceticella autotrophica]
MGHHHDHEEISGKNLIITVFLNFAITIAEIVGGILAGSLSLISDALHNFSDGISVIISYFAFKISKKKNNERMTFGYKRAEILAALFNASVLVIVSIYLFKEAYFKFLRPEPVKGVLMITTAVICLAANIFSALILRKNAVDNLNVKSAYIHMLADAMSSFGVIVAGILIYEYKIYWIDPLLTILIGIYIIKESFDIINETLKILMQGVPDCINLDKIKTEIEKLPEIKDIHHVHVWQTNDKDVYFECHINVKEDIKLSQVREIIKQVESILKEAFNIHHVTLQIEYECCTGVGLIKQ